LERTHPGAAGILHDAMALRWCAAGMIQARGQFRRVNGHLHLPALRAVLDAHVATETVGAIRHDEPVIAA
jgi:hypothetical protein